MVVATGGAAGGGDRPGTPAERGAQRLVSRRALFQRLSAGGSGGVTLVAAPPGSGKTALLRSWVEGAGLRDRVAWVSVERDESDAQRFWLSVVTELCGAVGEEAGVERLIPTPDFAGEAVVRRLLSDLGALDEPVVLVIDDLHELRSAEALAQLELLLSGLPRVLRVVLVTRHDPHLGLHRLRLAGELTEVRASDLRFTLQEARELLAASGIALSDSGLAILHERTEGWAAGLRLAAISLAGHPEPERFVAEFSGSARTVGDYLLAEVLDRQPDEVRRLLLRTSVLERVSGPLADALTGSSGSERILQVLEEANAFVVSLDAGRSWFRYHHLFADLLRLELRRTEPDAVGELHRTAARWYADHGHAVEAIRHLQAAEDWQQAARLLADHSFSLLLNGRGATTDALLRAFPAGTLSADAELVALHAGAHLARGSFDEAAAHIALAERRAATVPAERRLGFHLGLGLVRLRLARRRGDVSSVLDEVQALLEPSEARTSHDIALSNDLRAVALMNLGIVELWSLRLDDAERHLEEGLQLARRVGRPYVEIGCLGHLGVIGARRSFALARRRCEEAVALAEARGWEADPIAAIALAQLGDTMVWAGRFGEAEHWLDRAERACGAEAEPATGLLLRQARGMLHAGEGRLDQAVAAFRAAEEMQRLLVTRHAAARQVRSFLLQTQVRLGETAAVRSSLTAMGEEERRWAESCAALAAVCLAEGSPRAAVDALTPVLDGSAAGLHATSAVQALLLGAIARDRLGDAPAAEAAVEGALELAEPDGLMLPFAMTPIGHLLERHPRHRTAHAALLSDILDMLAGSSSRRRGGETAPEWEPLTDGELRVLRYLPSSLSAQEIGSELYVSLNTVKTHTRRIYEKLAVHRRTAAVARARELGLLAPSSSRRR
ncbi:MAG: LuxR family transcriptional regulator, maltose regulon positive regulatory protein [Chloroflexota bacterium]|nr:LuxR family transcriptional regulator, maltose regulon positive regulatory protein [Chloroflexota bacterium]